MAVKYQVDGFYAVAVNNAKKAPNKTILYFDEEEISNSTFKLRIDSVASKLKDIGVKKDDKVAIVMGNCWQYMVNVFAINKLGAVVVLVNNMLKEEEISYILNDSQSKVLFASGKFAKPLQNVLTQTCVQRVIWVDDVPLTNELNIDFSDITASPRDTAPYVVKDIEELSVIIYTSGTTGRPKGAMLPFRSILSNVNAALEALDLKEGQAKMICYLPMFHAFTFTVTIFAPILTNSGVVVIASIGPKTFPRILQLVLKHRIKYFPGVPDVFSAMAKAKLPWYYHVLSAVRGYVSGAAPLSDAVIERFNKSFALSQKLGKGKLLQGYGISECSPLVSCNTPKHNRNGSVGKAFPGYQVATFDDDMNQLRQSQVGELCVKGGCVMLGYYNRPQDTAEAIVDGWFRTGDIGRVDEDGYIFIMDRKKDLIISKGINIYPREIEEAIYQHPKVNACAVVGLKDADADETPIAYIELKEGESATEAEIKDFIKPHLATFKQPRKIYFMDQLPRNATQKILKRELRDMLNKK